MKANGSAIPIIVLVLVLILSITPRARGGEPISDPELAATVSAEIGKIRRDPSVLFGLTAVCFHNPAALPILAPYAADPDRNVRGAVLACYLNIDAPETTALIAPFLSDRDLSVSRQAADSLFQTHIDAVRASSSVPLIRSNLRTFVTNNPDDARGILLLATLSHGDKATRDLLTEATAKQVHRLVFKSDPAHPGQNVQDVVGPIQVVLGSDPTEIGICLDAAFAEMGFKDALKKLDADVRNGDADSTKSFLIAALPAITNRSALTTLSKLLKSRTETNSYVGVGQMNDQVPAGTPHLRVCDFAVAGFAKRLGCPLGIKDVDDGGAAYRPCRRFTDGELEAASKAVAREIRRLPKS